MTPMQEQQEFLAGLVFGSTLAGTTQRGHLYRKESNELIRKQFRSALRFALENLWPQYKQQISHEQHCANIKALSDELSGAHMDALIGGRFRIGSAQKALNLYLKFMWCLDQIERPPHCPFDSWIVSKIPGCKVKWTQLTTLDEYEYLVGQARRVAGDMPLAEWELREYQKIIGVK